MKAKAHIAAGICGFQTDVFVDCPGMFEKSLLKIKTDCPNIQKLADIIPAVYGMNEMKNGVDAQILTEARKIRSICASCIVPSAILKAVMVANMMALPKDVQITISKEE